MKREARREPRRGEVGEVKAEREDTLLLDEGTPPDSLDSGLALGGGGGGDHPGNLAGA